MTALSYVDFFDRDHDADSSPRVVNLFKHQFPDLYQATNRGEIKTADRRQMVLGGDTLITYRSAVKKIYGKYFSELDTSTMKDILSALEVYSVTAYKKIQFSDGKGVVNNHQIGNMMPFPSSLPSMNTLRAGKYYDYFDRFLNHVKGYYDNPTGFLPSSKLQEAIYYQHGYFDFFKTYDNYIERNFLQDFVGKDLWGIADFREYLRVANEIIDSRGKRFTIQLSNIE